MAIPDVKKPHIGRKIKRIRELRGMKQDTLAAGLGVSQQAVSKMEQSEDVDDERLNKVAEILGVSADAIKNYNDENVINYVQNNYDNTVVSSQVQNQFNPIEKLMQVVEENKTLYERLLDSERKRNELLEGLLKGK